MIVAPGVHRLSRPERGGWTIDMTVVALGGDDGACLVYSPTWLGDETRERVSAIGSPRVLLAPNHYHHLSLSRFGATWPDAVAIASDDARPRLARQGHALRDLDAVSLGPDVRLLPCEGTKTGETWVAIRRADPAAAGGERRVLIVADAFFHVPGPLHGTVGFALRALRTAPGLKLGRTFRWLAIADRAAYRRWALSTLERERPDTIVFAHGEPLVDPDAAARCAALVDHHLS